VVALASAREMTARHELEAELVQRGKQQAAVAELGRRATTATDPAALIEDAVDAVVRVLGVQSAKVITSDSDGTDEPLADEMSATIEEGNGRVGRLAVHSPARTLRQHESDFVQGVANVVGAVIARRRDEQLHVQLERLRRVEVFAGAAAHDMKNLLGVILSCAEFALDVAFDQPELRADLMDITEAARRATAVADSLQLHATEAVDFDAMLPHGRVHEKSQATAWPCVTNRLTR
jgi:signal transduction histidine kinase